MREVAKRIVNLLPDFSTKLLLSGKTPKSIKFLPEVP